MSIAIDLLKSEHIGVRELRDHLCGIINDPQNKERPLVVTERGTPVKVIMPYSKMVELLEVLDEVTDPNTMRNIHEGIEAIERRAKGVPFSRIYRKYTSKTKKKR